LPVFSYLNLGKIERKNCAQAQEACDARLFVLQNILQYRGKIAVMLSFFLLATSLLSERMVSFDPLCGIAARKETMKLAGLRLRVIWTLPVFYYLN